MKVRLLWNFTLQVFTNTNRQIKTIDRPANDVSYCSVLKTDKNELSVHIRPFLVLCVCALMMSMMMSHNEVLCSPIQKAHGERSVQFVFFVPLYKSSPINPPLDIDLNSQVEQNRSAKTYCYRKNTVLDINMLLVTIYLLINRPIWHTISQLRNISQLFLSVSVPCSLSIIRII